MCRIPNAEFLCLAVPGCASEVFGSFLPALTAGRRKGQVAMESSEEENPETFESISRHIVEALYHNYIIIISYKLNHLHCHLQETSSSADYLSAEDQTTESMR